MSRRLRLGLLTMFAAACAIAFTVLLLYTFSRPGLRVRIDLSSTGTAGLSDRTVSALNQLPEGSRLTAFLFPEDDSFRWFNANVYPQAFDRITSLVEDARVQSGGKLETLVIDINSPMVAREREINRSQRKPGEAIVLESVDQRRVISFEDLFQILRANVNDSTPARIQRERVDTALGDAAVALASGSTLKAGIVTGYGQASATDPNGLLGLSQLLVRDNWEPIEIEGPADAVDCDLLIFVDQKQPFLPSDLKSMEDWLAADKAIMVALGPNASPAAAKQWNTLLKDRGTGFEPGLICEPIRSAAGMVEGRSDCAKLELNAERFSGQHPITIPLIEDNRLLLVIGARPVIFQSGTNDYTQERLLRTDPLAWADSQDPNGLVFSYDKNETRGIRSIAVATERWSPGKEGRMGRIVALGSAASLSAGLEFNRDFITSSLQWLGGDDRKSSGLIGLGERPFQPDRDSIARINNISVYGIPGVTFLIGLWVFWRRRR
ncbi:MAG: hypothetical protein GY747_06770 [Planctomycetes bacterium]|nr:hypothetical protein [Planctomycetota bacterium]MCP4772435.1 hypothetical protein [Planctomycetota bacterium]MCP4860172.1 hypothetical protein [Planctomycetota bacterium]